MASTCPVHHHMTFPRCAVKALKKDFFPSPGESCMESVLQIGFGGNFWSTGASNPDSESNKPILPKDV